MKYQIQIYKEADPNKEREIFANTEGVFTQDAINQWYFETIGENEAPEGCKFTLVPDNHAWFISDMPQGELGTNENHRINPDAKPIETKELPNDVLLVREKERRLKERERRIAHEKKVRETLRELQAQR